MRNSGSFAEFGLHIRDPNPTAGWLKKLGFRG